MQSFNTCTQPLGALRQSLFACLTCSPSTPAGLCYSCSIACHGEHTLVELFNKRGFVCDCGTTRLPSSAPCTLRNDPKTGAKGVHSQDPAPDNKYNHNFKNKFCGCGEDYDADKERGTMFQCLGLGTVETGGCGEDWWHPECVLGLPREHKEVNEGNEHEELPLPPGFPGEDDFWAFICYKCVGSNPWLKRYAGTTGFLPPVYHKDAPSKASATDEAGPEKPAEEGDSKKRKLDDEEDQPASKRAKADDNTATESTTAEQPKANKHDSLPKEAPQGTFSLFFKEDFRDHLCRCPDCFPNLAKHPQLREEEDTYEPPLSDDGDEEPNGSTGTKSLLDRGEVALNNIDRVRAIEGAMVYNHLRDKVKDFLKPFAESGTAVGAEDIKSYFEKLRGDDQPIRDAAAGQASASNGDTDNGDEGGNKGEQSGA